MALQVEPACEKPDLDKGHQRPTEWWGAQARISIEAAGNARHAGYMAAFNPEAVKNLLPSGCGPYKASLACLLGKISASSAHPLQKERPRLHKPGPV